MREICINFGLDALKKLYQDISLPDMVLYSRKTVHNSIKNIRNVLHKELSVKFNDLNICGMKIAIAIGSRGIDRLDTVVKGIIDYLIAKGAEPFIVPAMGSHGGATSEGQKQLLADYGITAEKMGIPVISSMDVEDISNPEDGAPIYISSDALKADKIFLVNRIKPHTDFSGRYESGLMKLIAVGLGKHIGALAVHKDGFENMAANVERNARKLIGLGKILGGVALIENEEHKLCYIEAVTSDNIAERDAELLKLARTTMGRLPFEKLDVLFVCRMGKEISGSGMDPNVIGRARHNPDLKPKVDYVICSDLTDHSRGNAIGLGNADIVTERLIRKVDFEKTYINGITSRGLWGAKIPVVAENDVDALKLSIFLCDKPADKIRIACIRDTNTLNIMYLSPALYKEAENMTCQFEKLVIKQNYIEF